nr:immunoglobulin heavy chain junction region [Mus musculus]
CAREDGNSGFTYW